MNSFILAFLENNFHNSLTYLAKQKKNLNKLNLSRHFLRTQMVFLFKYSNQVIIFNSDEIRNKKNITLKPKFIVKKSTCFNFDPYSYFE